MKIAILTLPFHTNYGGILQAYALQTVLKRMGHDVKVIDQDQDVPNSLYRNIKSIVYFILKKYILRKQNIVYHSMSEIKKRNKERGEREQYTRCFVDKYLSTLKIRDIKKDFPNDFDVIIVGSDQIWRRLYFRGYYRCGIENAFLKFCSHLNIKRVSYAASFGSDIWDYSVDETKECRQLLGLFDAVSVREASAVDICRTKLGRTDVKLVLDPTLLLMKEDYIKLVDDAKLYQSTGNLMCYILDKNDKINTLVQKVAKDKNLIPFVANSEVDNEKLLNVERIQPPVEKWLRAFMDAEFVITDSFHACVFSIIFGKPFITIGNIERGLSRFESLLNDLNLKKHLITSMDDYDEKFDYQIKEDTYNRIIKKRKASMSFLLESLV